MKKNHYMFGVFLTMLSIAGIAEATPVQWEGTGHWYEYISQPMDWSNARLAAEQRLFNGAQGYLATITSEDERMFIHNNWTNLMWLGAYQDTTAPDYAEPVGGWRWITGETWQYTAWYPGEPNEDMNLSENFLITDGYGWNDTTIYTDGRYGEMPGFRAF